MPELIDTDFAKSLGNEVFPTIANNSTDADHDLDIEASTSVWVSNGTLRLSVSCAAMTKRIDAAWAAGTNQGGLDTGTVANTTWYYLYLIYNPTTDVSDYLISTSASSPTLPSGFTYYRSVKNAAFLTDGSANIIACTYHGDYATFGTVITDLDLSSSFVTTATVSTPPNFRWIGEFALQSPTQPCFFSVRGGGVRINQRTFDTTETGFAISNGLIRTDGSSQVILAYEAVSKQVLTTRGFLE